MNEEMHIDTIPSPTPLEIFHTGPDLAYGPLPTIIYFALSGPESLNTDPFNQPITHLKNQQIRKFSFTLPYHGPGHSNSKAMEQWARCLKNNEDFLTPFLKNVITNISYLIDQGYIDDTNIAAAGLSRGGFIATHLAARDHRIGSILGFAPITKFGWMREYEDRSHDSMARQFDLTHIINQIIGKPLRYYIGNRDQRVGTDSCFSFVSELTEASFQQGHRSPNVELFISPSIGHKGHGTPQHIFNDGAEWLSKQFKI
ncbi:MAG: prolyl oligopeptidase family serine peptidase [Chlamydiota bacterium]|nr:prolyl oligopeptidase family serine peptidase [Chlamydiota bacterium]